jgi:hypothetical protein
MSKIKIIEKIKKLMLHERSARLIESYAEADRFAEQINALREKHSITQEIIIDEDDFSALDDFDGEFVFTPDSPMFKRKRVIWEEQLFTYAAGYFECRGLLYKRSNLKAVVGEKEAREKAVKSYLFLYEMAQKLLEEFTDEFNDDVDFTGQTKRLARESFLHGFVSGIFERLSNFKEMELHLKDWQKHIGGQIEEQSSQGLVKTDKIVSSKKREKIEEAVNDLPIVEEPKPREVSGKAFYHGMKSGLECELNEEITKPAIENYEKFSEIQEKIRRQQQSRYNIRFSYGYNSTSVTYQAPVQMRFIFDEGENE